MPTTNFQKVSHWIEGFEASHDLDLWFSLIVEEFTELKEAWEAKDWTKVLDGLCDLEWVIDGFAYTAGIDFDGAFAEVDRSNWSKLGENGKPLKREDGKILKGPNFSEPKLKHFVRHLLQEQRKQAMEASQ